MNDIRLTFPFPPSVNHTWMRGSGKRLYSSPKVKEFHSQASMIISEGKVTSLNLSQRLSVTLVLHEKDNRKRDIDNYTKQIFDALTKNQVWLDDAQVDSLLVTRGDKNKESPCVDVVIRDI